MQALEQALETYDLVSDVALRRYAAKTLKGFKMGRAVSMNHWHRLLGSRATVLWFPDSKIPTAPDFYKDANVKSSHAIEKWWSVRDAIKYVATNPRRGLRPWLMVNAEIFHPDHIIGEKRPAHDRITGRLSV